MMWYLVIIKALVPILMLCFPVILILSFLKTPWFKGVCGEFYVHVLAKIHLNKDKYHVLRNVTLPTTDGTTQIDHIIVSEYGVFVIETKNMKGWIFGGTHQRQWTQKIFKYTNKFQNPIHQNYKHVETLKSILELNDRQIFSVVVFVGSSTFKTDMPENVINGPGLIKYIKSKDQSVLFDADVQMILSKIEAERLVPSRKTTRAHIDHVKQIVAEKQTRLVHIGSGVATAIQLSDDRWSQDIEIEPAFTDSWENRSWQIDQVQTKFKDRAFP
ncbi:nuclease-related domain-containing protein [uncultured Desulfosarcina sp.]|uniref:nuclease-related domain-containing protein n=1 Tax=uncultured Desulfosarcina sp. TaxID=218289 RepID=UPI0029C76CC6|nr:nuclease-related domain-containing protein [uncultured Desulfosarcina sp.]